MTCFCTPTTVWVGEKKATGRRSVVFSCVQALLSLEARDHRHMTLLMHAASVGPSPVFHEVQEALLSSIQDDEVRFSERMGVRGGGMGVWYCYYLDAIDLSVTGMQLFVLTMMFWRGVSPKTKRNVDSVSRQALRITG